MNISDQLLCLFSGRIIENDGVYQIEVPKRELEQGGLELNQVYRVALLSASTREEGVAEPRSQFTEAEPPVQEHDIREVEIENLGDQGDGIARVERGFVIIVPEADVGETVTVEIVNVAGNYAIGEVIDKDIESSGLL